MSQIAPSNDEARPIYRVPPSQQRENPDDRQGRNHSRKASFGTSEPSRTESEVPKESKGGEEAGGLGSTCDVDPSGFDEGFGAGEQQGMIHANRINESVELVLVEAFSESLVKRGDSVIDNLRGHQ